MEKQSFKLLLNYFRSSAQKSKVTGFTLIELLVAMVMAGVMISVLLYIVVELLKIDLREANSNETQAEMQLALEYITSDLREAVYVYDDPSKIKAYIPDFGTPKPVIAFWRPNLVDEDDLKKLGDCSTSFTTDEAKIVECETLLLRRNTYSLVVYLQSKNDSSSIWKGQSRIMRYELPKYKDITKLELSLGYVDPSRKDTSFENWPKDGSGKSLQGSDPEKNKPYPPVLIDFVDDPGNKDSKVPSCDTSKKYARVPATTITELNNSFFTCVRPEEPGFNQDIFVFLRGNAFGKQGVFTDKEFLPTLQTQVIVRGVIDKIPSQ